MEKNNKNTNEKENREMQEKNRMSRLNEYRNRIIDLMDNLDDLWDDLDALQEDMEKDGLKEKDTKQPVEVPFPEISDEEDLDEHDIQMTVTIVMGGEKVTIPVDLAGGQYEH